MTDTGIASEGSLVQRIDGGRVGKRKIENCTKSDEESFEPEQHLAKKMGHQTNKSKFKVGGWSYQENQAYLQFMLENRDEFASESSRRRSKVFYRLSKVLKKRTADQCRSHHQKLQIKYKDDLQSIISEVYRKIQKSIAQQLVDYQHRFQFPPPCNSFQKPIFYRTGEEEQHSQREKHGWVTVGNEENCFRVEVREEQIGIYEELF